MNLTRAKQVLVTGLMVAAGMAATMGSASAAVYKGAWDPAYGSPFPDLGWRGEVVVTAPGSCISDGWRTNLPSDCNGGMVVNSASVELYDLSDTGTTLETLSFSGGLIAAMQFSSGALTGLITSPFTPVPGSIAQAQVGGNNVFFSLVFLDKAAQLYWFKTDPGNFMSTPTSWIPYVSCIGSGTASDDCGWAEKSESNTGVLMTFAPVPEPQAYVLMLAGLAGLGFIARRRRSQG